ncbi:MAG: ATP-binding protein [Acidimicrobiia bacterium]
MRRRLLVSYLTITLVVLLLLEIPLGVVYANEQRRRLTASVERDALALSIRAEEGLEEHDVRTVARLANDYRADTGGRVLIVDTEGAVIVDSDGRAAGEGSYANRPEIRAALARREATGSRSSRTLGHDILYFAVPIVNGNRLLGALRVTYPTSFVDQRIARGWWVLAGIGCIALLVVFLVSLRLARQVTVPIDRLVDTSARFGGGALAARAPVPRGPPEIRQLTESFNTTAARLERLVDAQREFVADASHQLRTPLHALRLRLEILESEVADQPDAAADVSGSLTEVARLSRLVDGLLELARAERTDAVAERVVVAELVTGRIEAWGAFADEHGVDFEAAIPADLAVRSVPGRLEQVLDNVIANAIEVSPAGAALHVGATRHGSMVALRVADEGPGLTEPQRRRAFDRFWRGSGAEGGSGLGLAIVRRLVENDGGTVELDAAPEGGLAVVLRLPAA